jgi:hypothetical protein
VASKSQWLDQMFGTFWEDSYDTLMVLHHVASVFFAQSESANPLVFFSSSTAENGRRPHLTATRHAGIRKKKAGYTGYTPIWGTDDMRKMLKKYVQP